MRVPRIYHPEPLRESETVTLRKEAARHLTTVLRLRPGAALSLFDGRGAAHMATLQENGRATVGRRLDDTTESPLSLHLFQAVSKGERMDFVIQKATELGVTAITPVITERCIVRLNRERAAKRLRHWQEILINACEQCGRRRLPSLHEIAPLDQALQNSGEELKLVLDPGADKGLRSLSLPAHGKIALLIGPEGGLTEEEIRQARQRDFVGLRLGPRTLRTETAAIAALSALQAYWGDLGDR